MSHASKDSGGIFVNIRLSGSNESILGYLHVFNATFVSRNEPIPVARSNKDINNLPTDPKGASYYVIVIVLIYGMSIIALIASHIKRKHTKLVEDRQIHKYLKEFQSIRDKSRKDAYRNSERAVLAHLQTHAPAFAPKTAYGNLGQALFPALAVATPGSFSHERDTDEDEEEDMSRTCTAQTESSFEHVTQTPTSEVGSPMAGTDAENMAYTWQAAARRTAAPMSGPSPTCLDILPPVVIDASYLDEEDDCRRMADAMLANAVICNDTDAHQQLHPHSDMRLPRNGALSPITDVDGFCLTPVSDISLSESFSSTVPLLPSVTFAHYRSQFLRQQSSEGPGYDRHGGRSNIALSASQNSSTINYDEADKTSTGEITIQVTNL